MEQFALQDLRVLDLSRAYAGPFCCMLLADMGATVIKIEDPKVPDFSRGLPPFGKGPPDRKSTRLNSSHPTISYDVFCLEKNGQIPSDALVILREWLADGIKPGDVI